MPFDGRNPDHGHDEHESRQPRAAVWCAIAVDIALWVLIAALVVGLRPVAEGLAALVFPILAALLGAWVGSLAP